MMTKIWTGMIGLAVACGAAGGRIGAVAAASSEGAAAAVELMLSILGVMCFWSGMMEVMQESGLAGKLSKGIRPLLRPLFGQAAEDDRAAGLLATNITANLLGLANAATPVGLAAAARLQELSGEKERACDGLVMLVVLNTASLQLIPTTVAALRASLGAADPFDILPAVWIASALSVSTGLAVAAFFAAKGRAGGGKKKKRLSERKAGRRA